MRFCCSAFGANGKVLLVGSIHTSDDPSTSPQRDQNQRDGEYTSHVASLAFHDGLAQTHMALSNSYVLFNSQGHGTGTLRGAMEKPSSNLCVAPSIRGRGRFIPTAKCSLSPLPGRSPRWKQVTKLVSATASDGEEALVMACTRLPDLILRGCGASQSVCLACWFLPVRCNWYKLSKPHRK